MIKRSELPFFRDAPASGAAERGTTLVETAVILPVLLLLTMAIIEGGFYMKSYLAVDDVVGSGVRTGSIARSDPDADQQILAALASRVKRDGIERVVIYHASSIADTPPPLCRDGIMAVSVIEECASYSGAGVDDPASVGCGWCAADREEGDLLGLWVQFTYESVSGLIDDVTFDQNMVLAIEADR